MREQERFEFIWKALKMPEKQRLDMAIKYSTLDKRGHLDQVHSEKNHFIRNDIVVFAGALPVGSVRGRDYEARGCHSRTGSL